MKKKKAFITGIAGQDGSYLAELLLSKGYVVVGLVCAEENTFHNLTEIQSKLELFEGNILDEKLLQKIISEFKPDEIYNLASFSSLNSPWENPVGVGEITGVAPVKILEAIRQINPAIRFFQASSVEMFGDPLASPQAECTPSLPRNPYGVAKLFAHGMVGRYREDHNIFACSGILFNHESPRRRDEFVTQKIVKTLTRIAGGEEIVLELGNLDSKRDWGFAGDYVEAMWTMLQAEKPDDYVIATGESHSVREFVEVAASVLGMKISWKWRGKNEVGKDADGKIIVRVNAKFYRPVETVERRGDISKIKNILGWEPKTNFSDLVKMMVESAQAMSLK